MTFCNSPPYLLLIFGWQKAVVRSMVGGDYEHFAPHGRECPAPKICGHLIVMNEAPVLESYLPGVHVVGELVDGAAAGSLHLCLEHNQMQGSNT